MKRTVCGPWGERIERLQKAMHWEKDDMARAMARSWDTISKVRRGDQKADVDFVRRLAFLEKEYHSYVVLWEACEKWKMARKRFPIHSTLVVEALQSVKRAEVLLKEEIEGRYRWEGAHL